MASVSVYLNFPGNAEEALNFYKSVFGGEFDGPINRFGEMPASEGQPPLSDAIKEQVLHMSYTILGGAFTLMASDAPKEFGMDLQFGNNMHINLNLDSREETKRLYEALSAGGKVTMELQDTFWGSYFGSCVDKFGVCWMFDHANRA